MLSPDYYRKQANSCLRLARETSDATLAKRLNALAADFMHGAMELERHDPSRGPAASRPESADNGMQPQSADRSASQRHRR
jgi:hypothetical protein